MVLEVIFHTSRFLHPIIVKMTIIFNQHLDKNQAVLTTNPQNKNTTKNRSCFYSYQLMRRMGHAKQSSHHGQDLLR